MYSITDDMMVPLLDHLAQAPAVAPEQWQAWVIAPVEGGANNRLLRATWLERGLDLAVKFSLRDDRRRAEREFAALHALRDLPRAVAPAPVWLETGRYPNPVVVQTWLNGPCHTNLPEADEAWLRLLQVHALVHMVRPGLAPVEYGRGAGGVTPILGAVTTAHTPGEALDLVRAQMARVPAAERPTTLEQLARRLEAGLTGETGRHARAWAASYDALCHVDGNLANFIRRPMGWLAVDWENSGWGDPAFEIADLLAHPACLAAGAERLDWAIQTYSRLAGDRWLAARTRVYYRVLLVWWVARLSRALYEVPRGQDPRLVQRPPAWAEETRAKLERYVRRAEEEVKHR